MAGELHIDKTTVSWVVEQSLGQRSRPVTKPDRIAETEDIGSLQSLAKQSEQREPNRQAFPALDTTYGKSDWTPDGASGHASKCTQGCLGRPGSSKLLSKDLGPPNFFNTWVLRLEHCWREVAHLPQQHPLPWNAQLWRRRRRSWLPTDTEERMLEISHQTWGLQDCGGRNILRAQRTWGAQLWLNACLLFYLFHVLIPVT